MSNKVEPVKEAMFYKVLDGKEVRCTLCPRYCIIGEGKRGFCRNRENRGGKLYTAVYGRPSVVDTGPVEKAPLYHFIPGHFRLCLTCCSCNLRCSYCQNWHLSQRGLEELGFHCFSPSEIVEMARKRGLFSISFTYAEPTVYYEYVYDISRIARGFGMKTSIVSNGYINEEPLLNLLSVLDAVKIDLKGFSERFYRKVCQGSLRPVLDSLVTVKREGIWLEIVNLIVPNLNDDPGTIEKMCIWIKENLGQDTPLHFTRFFPNYRMIHLEPTPIRTLESAFEIAKRVGLRFVYIGNVPGHPANCTYCPACGRKVIHRSHMDASQIAINSGKCSYCDFPIAGRWY